MLIISPHERRAQEKGGCPPSPCRQAQLESSIVSACKGKLEELCQKLFLGRERAKKKLLTSGPWVSCYPNRQFRAKPGQQPLSHLQGLVWLYPSLPSGEKWQEDRNTVGCWQRPRGGERLVVVPRPFQSSPARTLTCAQGLQPPRDLQMLKSKQSTCR